MNTREIKEILIRYQKNGTNWLKIFSKAKVVRKYSQNIIHIGFRFEFLWSDNSYIFVDFVDSDKDGYLSMNELFDEGETEFKEEEQEEIKAIDTDGDGKLSKEELSNYIEREHEESEEEDEKEDPAEAKEGYINQFFEKQDLDKDGVITYEEFHANRDEL